MTARSTPVAPTPSALSSGTAFTLLAALGFAAVSTLTQIALDTHVSLYTILTWRYALGATVMVLWVGTQKYPRMPWKEAVRFVVAGGGGQALFVGMALSSLRYIPAATLAFLFYSYPMWVTLVQAVRGAEPLTVRRVSALALSLGGIVVIVLKLGAGDGSALSLSALMASSAWNGIALALGAAMLYGLYIPLMQWMQKKHPVTVTSAYAKIGSALCFLALAVSDRSFTMQLTGTAWAAVAALVIFSTVLPSVFFLMGLMRLGPVRTAIVSTVEPFLTALLGALILRQALSGSVLIGGAMIVSAVVMLQFRRERVA